MQHWVQNKDEQTNKTQNTEQLEDEQQSFWSSVLKRIVDVLMSWYQTGECQYKLHCVIYRKAFLKIVTLQGIFIHFIIN